MASASTLRNVEGPFRITWLKKESTAGLPGHAHLRLVPDVQRDKYEELAIRRRRAQIAARHALGLE